MRLHDPLGVRPIFEVDHASLLNLPVPIEFAWARRCCSWSTCMLMSTCLILLTCYTQMVDWESTPVTQLDASPKRLRERCRGMKMHQGIHSGKGNVAGPLPDLRPHQGWAQFSFGCGFFAYSWKLPAYSGFFWLTVGSFLLTVELFYLQLAILASLLTVGAFLLTILAFLLTILAFLLTVGSASNKGLKGL